MEDKYEEAVLLYNKALEYMEIGEYEQAINFATQSINSYPELPVSYKLRGDVYFLLKDYKNSIIEKTLAIEYMEKREKEIQNSLTASDNSENLKFLKDIKKAKAICYFNRGNAYDEIKDFENAIIDFSEAISLYPEFANAYHSRGCSYINNADYINAINDFTSAINNNYDFLHFAYTNRAEALYQSGKYNEAISDCQAAIDKDPTYTRAYNNCGIIYEEMNDFDNAWLYYQRAIAVNPAEPAFRKNLEKLGFFTTKYYHSPATILTSPDKTIGFGEK